MKWLPQITWSMEVVAFPERFDARWRSDACRLESLRYLRV